MQTETTLRAEILKLKKTGLPPRKIVAKLNEAGFITPKGKKISASTVNYHFYKRHSKVHTKKNSNSKDSHPRFSITWIKDVLTEKTLQDGEKVRILTSYLND
jgi:hypothetical protein